MISDSLPAAGFFPNQPVAPQAAAPASGINDFRSALGQAFGFPAGQVPDMRAWNANHRWAFDIPFLASMYGPFMQSFNMAGLGPQAQQPDPLGDQVRQLVGSPKGRERAGWWNSEAEKAQRMGDDVAYVQYPNGQIVGSGTFDKMYADPSARSMRPDVTYLSGSEAAQRMRDKAAGYLNQ